MAEETLHQLLLDARDGKPGAMDSLLESYRGYLRLLARTWIHRSLRAKTDGSDAVQETLVNAYERFDQFRGETEKEFAAWLRKALARNLLNLARHFHAHARRVEREESLEAMLERSASDLGRFGGDGRDSPSSVARKRESGVLLAEALDKLSADHREVIVLRSLQELEWEDVAREMGRTADAVRKLWVRALAELRPLIEFADDGGSGG